MYQAHLKDQETQLRDESVADFGITKACENRWHDLENDDCRINWVLFRFVKSTSQEGPTWILEHFKEGTGGMEEMNCILQSEQDVCLYGGFRVNAVDERDSVTSRRCKLIFVSSFGTKVKSRVKSNSGMYIGQITAMCQALHVKMHTDGGTFVKEEVIGALLTSTGSHKPTKWEF